MCNAPPTTEHSRSAGPSPLRLRIGVLLILLWIVPFWLLGPVIADALKGLSSPPSAAGVTTAIVVVQTVLGLIGFVVAGAQVKSIVKGSTTRHAIGAIWSIFIHGEVGRHGDGTDEPGGHETVGSQPDGKEPDGGQASRTDA